MSGRGLQAGEHSSAPCVRRFVARIERQRNPGVFSSLRAKRSNPATARNGLLRRGACHRAGHFGPDSLSPRNDASSLPGKRREAPSSCQMIRRSMGRRGCPGFRFHSIRATVAKEHHTMNDTQFAELAAWIAAAGLAGEAEPDLVGGFCERLVAIGFAAHPRARSLIDTLHPVYEGRAVRLAAPPKARRRCANTAPRARAKPRSGGGRARSTVSCNPASPLLRRRVDAQSVAEFPILAETRGRHDRLRRAWSHRFTAARHHRRDGLRLFVLGDRSIRTALAMPTSPTWKGWCRCWRWR